VGGPHLAMLLTKVPGFGPETKVAPAGAPGPKEWRPAKDVEELKVLFPAPAAAPPPGAPADKAKG
jgi:hypothetical protein